MNNDKDIDIDEFIEKVVAVHTSTVNRLLRKNHTIGEAVAEATKEARQKLNQYYADFYRNQILEAFKYGLITGAMPEAIGKPIAEDYIAKFNSKGDKKL